MSVIATMNKAPRELNQGGTSTSLTVFTTDGTVRVRLPLNSSGLLAKSTGPGSCRLRVTAFGRVTGGTATNYTATLQFRDNEALETTIEASTARAVDSASHVWAICAEFTWDATSKKIQGRGYSEVSNLVDAVAALDNVVTTDGPASSDEMGFVVAGTFSSGNASNAAYLDGFFLERIGG